MKVENAISVINMNEGNRDTHILFDSHIEGTKVTVFKEWDLINNSFSYYVETIEGIILTTHRIEKVIDYLRRRFS